MAEQTKIEYAEAGHVESSPEPLQAKHHGHVVINGQDVPLESVLTAYAGVARAGAYIPPERNLPSMVPAGLIGFGVATFYMGLLVVGTRGVKITTMAASTNWFVGGVGLLVAGMWEFVLENTFGAMSCSFYGLNWWVQAAIETPSFGITENIVKYVTEHPEKMPPRFTDATEWATYLLMKLSGVFLLGMVFVSFMQVGMLFKSTVAFCLCLTMVATIYLCMAIGYLRDNSTAITAGGAFCIAAGTMAFYNAFAGIMTKENSFVRVMAIPLPNSIPKPVDEESQSSDSVKDI